MMENNRVIRIVFSVLVIIIYVLLLALFPLAMAMVDYGAWFPVWVALVLSLGTGELVYWLLSYEGSMPKRKATFASISGVLAFLMAAGTLVNTVISEMAFRLQELTTASSSGLVMLFFPISIPIPIIFLIALVAFNFEPIIDIFRSKNWHELLWYLIPIAIYAVLAILAVLFAQAILIPQQIGAIQ
ncbi:MAG: hypothetical protein ABIC95_00470 [archaeon]